MTSPGPLTCASIAGVPAECARMDHLLKSIIKKPNSPKLDNNSTPPANAESFLPSTTTSSHTWSPNIIKKLSSNPKAQFNFIHLSGGTAPIMIRKTKTIFQPYHLKIVTKLPSY